MRFQAGDVVRGQRLLFANQFLGFADEPLAFGGESRGEPMRCGGEDYGYLIGSWSECLRRVESSEAFGVYS
jgi:hypothetical protein